MSRIETLFNLLSRIKTLSFGSVSSFHCNTIKCGSTCFLITVIMFIHIRGVFRTKSDIQRGVLCGYNKLFTVDVSPASKDISEACSPRVIFIRIGQILVATCKNDAVCRIRLFLSARFIKLNTSNYCRRGFCGTETLSCLILGCVV